MSIVFDPAGSQLSEFTCFRKLPLEIRSVIWTYISTQSRSLDLWLGGWTIRTSTYCDQDKNIIPFEYQAYKLFTHQPVPAVLHVNIEARAIGMNHYELVSSIFHAIEEDLNHAVECDCRPPPPLSLPDETIPSSKIWINRHCDRIRPIEIDDDVLREMAAAKATPYLAINLDVWWQPWWHTKSSEDSFRVFCHKLLYSSFSIQNRIMYYKYNDLDLPSGKEFSKKFPLVEFPALTSSEEMRSACEQARQEFDELWTTGWPLRGSMGAGLI